MLVFLISFAGCGQKQNVELIDAAKEGNDSKVKSLLSAGEDVNAKDKDGRSPLSLAIQQGHKKIVELLPGQATKD